MRLTNLMVLVFWVWLSGVGMGAEAAGGGVALPETTLLDTETVRLVEGPNDGNVAKITARILEHSNYRKQAFNDEISSQFLDKYLDSLDNLHIYFLQSDLEEFEKYRTSLDELTYREGDTRPARVIFNRFRDRIEEQYKFVLGALRTEQFDLTTDERYILNRKDLPRPKDMAEAEGFWLERVRYEYLQEKLNKKKHEEIVEIITKRYTRLVRRLREYENDDVLQIYLTSLAHVYDPHSDYFGRSDLENFSIGMKLSLFGIGALLRSEDGYCKIQSLVPEGPAEKSKKLQPNDQIIAVAQGEGTPVDVVDTPLRKVVDLIRGPEGTEVRLTVIPADAEDPSVRKVVTLIRDKIKLADQAAKAKIIEVGAEKGEAVRLGVIDLPSFYAAFDLEGEQGGGGDKKSTTEDVAKLLEKLKEEKVAGLILDLRRNGGGSLEEAINLTGLFIKSGTVVQVKDSNNNVFEDKDTDPRVLYDGPLVVLTSRFSASASEILAGALQDCGRALIVGDSSTHGKGTVQSLIQLAPILRSHNLPSEPSPGAVKITIRKFYLPSGSSTQLKGVVPDIILPSVNNHADVGEAALDNPMAWDTIAPGHYEKLDRVEPYLKELRTKSEVRLAEDKDFEYVREEIERYKRTKAEKSVSMNEEKRLKEKEEADARVKKRRKELAGREEPAEKVYEISLKAAGEPGLPEAVQKKVAAEEGGSGVVKKEEEGTEKKGDLAKAEGEEEEEEDVPLIDITLEETKRILLDYIGLSPRGALAATGLPGAK